VDTLLLVVTVLSLVAAFVSVMAVRRLKQNDQLRSEARVAALVAAADEIPASRSHELARPAAPQREGAWKSVAGEWQWNPASQLHDDDGRQLFAPEKTDLRREQVVYQRPTQEEPVKSAAGIFGTVQREAPTSGRFAFVGALALVVALGGAAIIFGSSHVSSTAARSARSQPIELVSLGHSREASMLTISGIVRNPPTGPKLEGLTAVVSLIDEHGGLISTKDVPLDYRALGPGEEAPFKVTVPDPGSVARYRVSFRAGTDVVPHVDRRTDTKLASAL